MSVEVPGFGILFVYINEDTSIILDGNIHKCFSEATSEIFWQNKKHFYLVIFNADESGRYIIIMQDNKFFNGLEGMTYIRNQIFDV